MGIDGVAEGVSSHVCVCVWGLGGADEGETHDVALGSEAVFAVVEDGDAVVVFTEIGEFVAADFEFGHVPSGVEVGWAPGKAVLGLVGGFSVVDVDREFYFEELHGFAPLKLVVESEVCSSVRSNSGCERHGGLDPGGF